MVTGQLKLELKDAVRLPLGMEMFSCDSDANLIGTTSINENRKIHNIPTQMRI